MEVNINIAEPEVVGTVHYIEHEISLEIGNEKEFIDIRVVLFYDNSKTDTYTLTSIEVEGTETSKDCVADDAITEVKKVFPDIDDEDFKKLGSLLDKKIDELLTKWEIHQE